VLDTVESEGFLRVSASLMPRLRHDDFPRGNLFDQTRLIGCVHDAERCELIVLRSSGFLAFALAIHVGGDCRNNDHALHDILVVDIDAEKGESAGHDTENHHANYGAPNAADSTG
jgi:hypothetical protein